jgi:hypothetical protein
MKESTGSEHPMLVVELHTCAESSDDQEGRQKPESVHAYKAN